MEHETKLVYEIDIKTSLLSNALIIKRELISLSRYKFVQRSNLVTVFRPIRRFSSSLDELVEKAKEHNINTKEIYII